MGGHILNLSIFLLLMRFLFLCLLTVSLNACSLLSTTPSADTLSRQFNANESDTFAYGTGSGATKAEATLAARLELSAQIYVHVSSEFKAAQQHLREDKNGLSRTSSSEQLNSFMTNHTSALLSNLQVEDTVKVREGWFVVVRMPLKKMEEARIRADRQAPALVYALLMNNKEVLTASALLRYAIIGLDKTLQQEIAKEIIYAPGIAANTTFEAFFKGAIEETKNRLEILPITDEERIRFALIDKNTYEPQSGFVIYLEGKNLETNHSGLTRFTPLENLPAQFSPILLGYHDTLNSDIDKGLLKAGSINTDALKKFEQTTIYVYTQPSNSLVTLMNGSKTINSKFSHKLFEAPSDNSMLKLIAETEENSHRSSTEIIGSPTSAVLYYSIKLSENSFGSLDISIANPKNSITLKDANDVTIVSGVNRIKKELEVGRYHIHIENADTKNFQSLDDSFTIHKNSEFKREYKALQNRQYFHRGYFTDLNLGYGSKLNDDFEIPLENGSIMSHKEFIDSYNADYPHNYYANLRRMRLTNAAIAISYGLDLGARSYKESGTDNKASLYSAGGHFGLGLWTSKLLGKASWVTANYNYSYYQWYFSDSKKQPKINANPAVDSFSRGYPFIDIGSRWDIYGIGVRLSDPSLAAPSLYLSIGATRTQAGYKLDEHSTAIKGVSF